jgi:hypothetical protein
LQEEFHLLSSRFDFILLESWAGYRVREETLCPKTYTIDPYTLGVLADFYTMTDLMKKAGFNVLSYRGSHGQSVEMATDYYARYGKHVGFKKPVTADNARACPDYQQYIGQIVNGLETDIVMGAYHFPQDAAITELEATAKKAAGANLLDPLRFGRWRD